MAISKWFIALVCSSLIVAASVTTTMFVSSQECNSNSNKKNSDSAFKNQPTIRGGSKGY